MGFTFGHRQEIRSRLHFSLRSWPPTQANTAWVVHPASGLCMGHVPVWGRFSLRTCSSDDGHGHDPIYSCTMYSSIDLRRLSSSGLTHEADLKGGGCKWSNSMGCVFPRNVAVVMRFGDLLAAAVGILCLIAAGVAIVGVLQRRLCGRW